MENVIRHFKKIKILNKDTLLAFNKEIDSKKSTLKLNQTRTIFIKNEIMEALKFNHKDLNYLSKDCMYFICKINKIIENEEVHINECPEIFKLKCPADIFKLNLKCLEDIFKLKSQDIFQIDREELENLKKVHYNNNTTSFNNFIKEIIQNEEVHINKCPEILKIHLERLDDLKKLYYNSNTTSFNDFIDKFIEETYLLSNQEEMVSDMYKILTDGNSQTEIPIVELPSLSESLSEILIKENPNKKLKIEIIEKEISTIKGLYNKNKIESEKNVKIADKIMDLLQVVEFFEKLNIKANKLLDLETDISSRSQFLFDKLKNYIKEKEKSLEQKKELLDFSQEVLKEYLEPFNEENDPEHIKMLEEIVKVDEKNYEEEKQQLENLQEKSHEFKKKYNNFLEKHYSDFYFCRRYVS